MHNIALIGAGRIGRIHAANIAALPALRLSHIVDPVAEVAQAIAGQTGAAAASLDQVMADPSIAGIVIASATDTHLDYSRRAIASGKAVFCEKPIDMDLARAQSAEAELGAAHIPLLVGFNRRFDPNFRALKQRIDNGEMGQVETVHIISHDPAPPPMDYVRTSGGLFKDMSIHDFDMARWLLGEEPTSIFAASTCLIDPEIGKAGDADTAKIVLRTASGKLCLISNSRRSGYGYDQRIEVFCSGGMIRAGNVRETTLQSWNESGAQSAPLQNFFLDRYAQAYRAEMNHFLQMLDDGVPPEVGYRDAVRALALADAATLSASSNAIVNM